MQLALQGTERMAAPSCGCCWGVRRVKLLFLSRVLKGFSVVVGYTQSTLYPLFVQMQNGMRLCELHHCLGREGSWSVRFGR